MAEHEKRYEIMTERSSSSVTKEAKKKSGLSRERKYVHINAKHA